MVDVKVPGGTGAPVPGVIVQVTPKLAVSLGTVAVIVTTPPAVTCRALARKTTELKSEGVPAQPAT